MKIKLFLSCLVLALSFGASATSLQVPHISVQGEASQDVTPDELYWRLSVRNEAKETQDVAKQHAETVSKVVRYLRKQGIKEKDIQTTNMQLSENTRYQKNKTVKLGYFASSQISFKLKALDKYVKFWNGLAQFKQVSMNGFSYSHSQAKEFKRDLRMRALLNAKEKAREMATVLGVKAGAPIAIEEFATGPAPYRLEMKRGAMSPMADTQTLSAGTIKFSMSVNVVFELRQ